MLGFTPIELYLIVASLTFMACLMTGHEEFFESWLDHGLQAFTFACMWPATLTVGFFLCVADWRRQRKKRRS
jgi:hypothetical protein